MDWTGGTRRRFAVCKNKGQLQRQKEHFAKVRAATKLLSSSRKDFEPLFRGDAELRQTQQAQARKHVVSEECSAHTPLSLDDCPTKHALWSSSIRTASRQQSGARESERNGQPPRSSSLMPGSSSSGYQHEDDMVHDMPDESDLLEQSRQRLLARGDWLGLRLSQPIRMRFPFSRDTEGICKRRIVHRSGSPEESAALRRATTPLFQMRPSSSRYMMHGALQGDDQMRIKIGSVTSSHTCAKSSNVSESLSGISCDSEPLSEESMLLQPDEDQQFLNVPNWRPAADSSLQSVSNAESRLEAPGSPAVPPILQYQTEALEEADTMAAVYSNSDFMR
ncbi:hypothetical protein K431DRAFT_293840 [Polychaeton citri CBS 116435]|uniref:Uncharacterized protein n=1 Tax=Polychaeton citri CBS 116435 TaxID=1314669 RepID=A0A9P4Q7B7_9PEZI|nr:hypothetical protein K431DRAFT_293840 [Polychaeton citri CBS 116435]